LTVPTSALHNDFLLIAVSVPQLIGRCGTLAGLSFDPNTFLGAQRASMLASNLLEPEVISTRIRGDFIKYMLREGIRHKIANCRFKMRGSGRIDDR
jgi:hypothetical protein